MPGLGLGGQEQALVALVVEHLVPQQQRAVGALGFALQPGQDNGVELQPLGFVQGHELQRGAVGVGRGVEPLQFGLDALELQHAVAGAAIEHLEVGLGVVQIGFLRQGERPPQRLPHALDPAPRPLLALVRQGQPEHLAQVRQPLLPVGAQARAAHSVLQQVPDAVAWRVGGQQVQIGQGQAAPGRAQQRQPVHAVGQVVKRAREDEQVLNRLALGQRFDLDRLKGQPLRQRAQRRHQRLEVAARAHQHRDAAVGVVGARLRDQRQHLLRFALGAAAGFVVGLRFAFPLVGLRAGGAVFDQRVPLHARQRVPGAGGTGRGEAHGATAVVVVRAKDVGKGLVDPAHQRRLRAVVAVQVQRLRLDGAQAVRAHLQKQPDFGFAKAVDRLHRVAHQK